VMCFCAFYFGECLEYIRLCMSLPASFYIYGIPSLIFYRLWIMPFVQILKNVKEAFWPFQHDQTKSLFLRAVHAVLCTDRSNVVEERYCLYSVCMLKKGIHDLKFLFIVVAFSLNLQSPVTVGWTVAL